MMRFATAVRGAIAAAVVMGGLSVAVPADASVVWSFTGNCEDCAAAAGTQMYEVTAELELTDYVEGTALSDENFVSFSYSGSNLMLPYTVVPELFPVRLSSPTIGVAHQFYSMSGNISNGGSQSLELMFGDGLEFTLGTEGNWFTCGTNGNGYYEVPCSWMNNNDYGGQGQLSRVVDPVPAPAAVALLGIGLGGFGFARRRRVR